MNPKILKLSESYLLNNNADCLAVGIINFNNNTIESIELVKKNDQIISNKQNEFYFDLASVSKPLINSLCAFEFKSILNKELELILNHRAGIVAWGLLPKNSWKDLILSYPVKESETLYSDYSANRFMLELERKTNVSFREICNKIWDKDVRYWLDLTDDLNFPQFGYVNSRPNFGKVHDPNAYNLREFTSHAGVFGTIQGVCKTMLNFNNKYDLLKQMKLEIEKDKFINRFVMGWDRALDLENSNAGKGCSKYTFGHLGFTGTSIWIDPELKLGHVILTNATKYYWYDKKELPMLRKQIGEIVWKN